MKKNDVLRKGDLRLRILMIKDTCCLCIKCVPINDPCFFDGDRELMDLAYQFCDEPAFYSYYSGCPSSACSFDAACALDIN